MTSCCGLPVQNDNMVEMETFQIAALGIGLNETVSNFNSIQISFSTGSCMLAMLSVKTTLNFGQLLLI